MRLGLGLLLIIFGCSAHARTFSTQSDTFAVFVRGSLDLSSSDNTLASQSAGTGAFVNSKFPYKVSGEFGTVFARPFFNIRTGFEVIHPPEIENISGRRSSDDVELYTLKNNTTVFIPKITMEANIKTWPVSRLFLSGGYGYAMLSARNSYTINSTGNTQFGGLTSFDEDLTGISTLYEGGVGFESLLSDASTFVIEAGYRSLIFDQIDFKNSTTNFKGSYNSGQTALTTDGKARSLDLSGFTMALSFRFWL